MTAAAYAAVGMILAGCAAYAIAALPDRHDPVLRARYLWARHIRRVKGPARDNRDDGRGCMTEDEFITLLLMELHWGHDEDAEGSRT